MLPRRYLRYVMFPLVCCAIGLVVILGLQGVEAAWVTLVLQLLSTSLAEAFGDEEQAGVRLAAAWPACSTWSCSMPPSASMAPSAPSRSPPTWP